MFRDEALAFSQASRVNQLAGDVRIAVPLPWQVVSYLMFAGLLVALLFAFFASYSRVETAPGAIVPDRGVATIMPSRSGIVREVTVSDGMTVEAGDLLAQVRTEEDSDKGPSTAEMIRQSIVRQDANLELQAGAADAGALEQQRQNAAVQAGLRDEIAQLETQISLQKGLIGKVQEDLARTRVVAARGFISQRDLQEREETLLQRQQGLAQLNQSALSKRAALVEAERSAAQLAAQARAQAAALAAARAQVGQQAATAANTRSYAIRSPVAGKVTALTVRAGQSVNDQTPLMIVVPAQSQMQAELSVPSAAIGFVKPGQVVRLAIDSFPYQQFGAVEGRVVDVAGSALSRADSDGKTTSYYRVLVKLDSPFVIAFGRKEPLIPGMTLTARIIAEKQSLIEWLFQPFFAVRRR